MSPRSRPRTVALATAALTLTFGVIPASASAAPETPVLWEGVIQDADGTPATAEVVAYARPAGADLTTGNSLVEVARTRTKDDGRYTLQAGPNGPLHAVADDAGWSNVMVVAFGADGSVSMAVDSVAWQPEDSQGPVRAASADDQAGHWVTSPAERELATARPGLVRAASADAPESSADPTERPAVMVLGSPGKPVVSAQGASRAPRIPMCAGPHEAKDMGVHEVGVGEIHVNTDWVGAFEYKTARSTSFQVGVQQEGKRWSANGSTSSVSGSNNGTGNKTLRGGTLYTYKAQMLFERFSWRCEIAGKWQWVYTLEPTEWTSGLPRYDGGNPPTCNRRYKSIVPPTGYHFREKGSGTTVQGAISVAGFSGSTTTTTSEGVYQYWESLRDEQRYLCGSTDHIIGNTRVHSPA